MICIGISRAMKYHLHAWAWFLTIYDIIVLWQIEEQLVTIVEAFKKRLEKLEWMDAVTKATAQEKVDRLERVIAYPDIIMHPEQMDEEYRQVECILD